MQLCLLAQGDLRLAGVHEHWRKGVRVMREDNPATEIANSLCECMNACVMLCLQRRNGLTGQTEVVMPDGRIVNTPEAQRDAILDAVSWFIEAAPLEDLPTVWAPDGTKDAIRNGAAVAARVKDAVLAWDGTTEPPPSLRSLAREFLVSVGMEGVLGTPPERNT
jgi:hypothetical protein